MTGRIYSTLDRNRVGPGLLLDQSELVVTTSEVCDLNRMILGSLAAYSGTFAYELYFWSQSRGDLSGLLSFGVALVGADLTLFVGESADSFGFLLADGEIWNDNASIETVTEGGERIAVGVVLSLSPTSCTCDFLVQGSLVYQATLPTGDGWLPAISIGSDEPGDISASVNFGQNRFDTMPDQDGWFEQSTGLPDITLSLCTEALLLTDADSSAAKVPYVPRLLNGRSASIRREPKAWFQESGRSKGASFTTMRFDNSRGDFNALLPADIRDASVLVRTIREYSRGNGDAADAVTVFTGVLEAATQPKVTEVEVTLKGSLSRFDRPLRCRFVPPFRDATSVGRILPIGLGAQRNIQPLLLDGEEEGGLYALGDAPMSNVTLATDQAAPLDPYSDPPQYRPSNSGAEIILDSPPIGRFAVDCSSVGQQYVIPGDDDVLNGDGDFTTWDSSGFPDGWEGPTTPSVVANGSITHVGSNIVRLLSSVPYAPVTTNPFYYGFWMKYPGVLEPGTTYRLTLNLLRVIGGTQDPAFKYGLAAFWRLSSNANSWITPFKEPVVVPFGQTQTLTYTFQIPRDQTTDNDLYISAIPYFTGTPPSILSVLVEFSDAKLERLGEYTIAPLDGITVKDAFTEILVNREREDPAVFSASDCEAIDAATGYKLGFRYTDVPNVLQVLQDIADQVGAAVFEDAQGVIRIRRLIDPHDGSPVAEFTEANVVMASVRQWVDTGNAFTTLASARPNCAPFGAGDFVTDTVTVPSDIRAQYQGPAQFLLSATADVANEYAAAKGGVRKQYRIDDPDQAQTEINRIANDLFRDKAIYISFDALFDGTDVGTNSITSPAHEIYYGDVITVSLPALDLEDVPMSVTATELFLAQGRINITARYIP
jgi:hypothetical protein